MHQNRMSLSSWFGNIPLCKLLSVEGQQFLRGKPSQAYIEKGISKIKMQRRDLETWEMCGTIQL